jgi:hypothetical protein
MTVGDGQREKLIVFALADEDLAVTVGTRHDFSFRSYVPGSDPIKPLARDARICVAAGMIGPTGTPKLTRRLVYFCAQQKQPPVHCDFRTSSGRKYYTCATCLIAFCFGSNLELAPPCA